MRGETGGCEHVDWFTGVYSGETSDREEFGRIIEGICPECDVPLERDGELGRCPCCHVGVAVRHDGLLLHLPFDVARVLARVSEGEES